MEDTKNISENLKKKILSELGILLRFFKLEALRQVDRPDILLYSFFFLCVLEDNDD